MSDEDYPVENSSEDGELIEVPGDPMPLKPRYGDTPCQYLKYAFFETFFLDKKTFEEREKLTTKNIALRLIGWREGDVPSWLRGIWVFSGGFITIPVWNMVTFFTEGMLKFFSEGCRYFYDLAWGVEEFTWTKEGIGLAILAALPFFFHTLFEVARILIRLLTSPGNSFLDATETNKCLGTLSLAASALCWAAVCFFVPAVAFLAFGNVGGPICVSFLGSLIMNGMINWFGESGALKEGVCCCEGSSPPTLSIK